MFITEGGNKVFLIVPFINELQLIRGFACEKCRASDLQVFAKQQSGDELQHLTHLFYFLNE